MTEKQELAITRKLKGIQPKEIKPYLQAINDGIKAKRFNVGQASELMKVIYEIHLLDREWNDDLDNSKRNALQDRLIKLLRDTMNSQACEMCKTGEDSLKFSARRVCQDCINNM